MQSFPHSIYWEEKIFNQIPLFLCVILERPKKPLVQELSQWRRKSCNRRKQNYKHYCSNKKRRWREKFWKNVPSWKKNSSCRYKYILFRVSFSFSIRPFRSRFFANIYSENSICRRINRTRLQPKEYRRLQPVQRQIDVELLQRRNRLQKRYNRIPDLRNLRRTRNQRLKRLTRIVFKIGRHRPDEWSLRIVRIRLKKKQSEGVHRM